MTKSNKTFSIDTDVLQRIKASGVNASALCNEFLKTWLGNPEQKETTTKEELLKSEAELVQTRARLLKLKLEEDEQRRKEAKCIKISF